MRVATGSYDIGPHDLPRDERGRRAWDFVCYEATGCADKEAAIELALSSADETLAETIQLRTDLADRETQLAEAIERERDEHRACEHWNEQYRRVMYEGMDRDKQLAAAKELIEAKNVLIRALHDDINTLNEQLAAANERYDRMLEMKNNLFSLNVKEINEHVETKAQLAAANERAEIQEGLYKLSQKHLGQAAESLTEYEAELTRLREVVRDAKPWIRVSAPEIVRDAVNRELAEAARDDKPGGER